MITTWAAIITPENFPAISASCAERHLNVDYDQLDADFDDVQYYELECVYAVLSYDDQRPHVAGCYTAQWGMDFEDTWQFTGETEGIWKRIELIQK